MSTPWANPGHDELWLASPESCDPLIARTPGSGRGGVLQGKGGTVIRRKGEGMPGTKPTDSQDAETAMGQKPIEGPGCGRYGDDCNIRLLPGVGMRDETGTPIAVTRARMWKSNRVIHTGFYGSWWTTCTVSWASRTLINSEPPRTPSYSIVTWVQIPFLLRDFFSPLWACFSISRMGQWFQFSS